MSTISQDSMKSGSIGQQIVIGAVGGSVAGVAMAGWAMATSLVYGNGFMTPVQLIAATVFGESALELTLPVLVTGLGLHMATSAALGAAVGPVLKSTNSLVVNQLIAIAWGIAAWAVFTFAVLPTSNPVMGSAVGQTPITWFVGHVIFGAVLGLTPFVARSVWR